MPRARARATAFGIVLAETLLVRFGQVLMPGIWPYWMDLSVGPRSIVLALGLAAACAVLAGVAPAVKATSPDVQANLQRTAAGTTVRFGPFTTLLIVAEVAISVGFLSLGTAAWISFMCDRSHDATIEVDRYLVASLRTPWVDPTEAEAETYLAEFGTRVAASHAGLYALMSFTVSQRTREIGIRTALGPGARNVVATIAKRAALQLLLGVAAGSAVGVWIVDQVAGDSEFAVPNVPGLVAVVCLAVVAFSALCCTAPTLRGLRIQPTEALKEA